MPTKEDKEFMEAHGISDEEWEFFNHIFRREMRYRAAIWILAAVSVIAIALLFWK